VSGPPDRGMDRPRSIDNVAKAKAARSVFKKHGALDPSPRTTSFATFGRVEGLLERPAGQAQAKGVSRSRHRPAYNHSFR